MADLIINAESLAIGSVEELDAVLLRSEQQPQFELWVSVPNGPSMAMLRNGAHAWLMYLRFSGDAGCISQGDLSKTGTSSFTLANGQVDEYPLSWCIDLDRCYQAVMYFFVNDGLKPEWITWRES